MTFDTRATARIYKDRATGRWTVVRHWRGFIIDRQRWRGWDDARTAAVWWVNG